MSANPNDIKYIAQVLGLQGEVELAAPEKGAPAQVVDLEGSTTQIANFYLERDFNAVLRRHDTALGSCYIDATFGQNIAEDAFVHEISGFAHGGVKPIFTGWEEHAIGLTFIREGDKLHLLYLNKGDTYFDSWSPLDYLPESWLPEGMIRFKRRVAQAYTWDLNETKPGALKSILSQVYKTCAGELAEPVPWWNFPLRIYHAINGSGPVRDSFDALFSDGQFVAAQNEPLSQKIQKSASGLGNCTHANNNMQLHNTLAAKRMRDEEGAGAKLSYTDALKQSKAEYKKARQTQRMAAFTQLLRVKDEVKSGWQEMAIAAFEKMMHQEQKARRRAIEENQPAADPTFMITTLVGSLVHNRADEKTMANLSALLVLAKTKLQQKCASLDSAQDLDRRIVELMTKRDDASFLTRWYYNWQLNGAIEDQVRQKLLISLTSSEQLAADYQRPETTAKSASNAEAAEQITCAQHIVAPRWKATLAVQPQEPRKAKAAPRRSQQPARSCPILGSKK